MPMLDAYIPAGALEEQAEKRLLAELTDILIVNEGADPAVMDDVIKTLDKLVPWGAGYQHGEGNAAAHIKAILAGGRTFLVIDNGRLMLGTWERIFFCEFDGPRTRKIHIKIIGDR